MGRHKKELEIKIQESKSDYMINLVKQMRMLNWIPTSPLLRSKIWIYIYLLMLYSCIKRHMFNTHDGKCRHNYIYPTFQVRNKFKGSVDENIEGSKSILLQHVFRLWTTNLATLHESTTIRTGTLNNFAMYEAYTWAYASS